MGMEGADSQDNLVLLGEMDGAARLHPHRLQWIVELAGIQIQLQLLRLLLPLLCLLARAKMEMEGADSRNQSLEGMVGAELLLAHQYLAQIKKEMEGVDLLGQRNPQCMCKWITLGRNAIIAESDIVVYG